MGRWNSRDPIEEQGGVNLYGMIANDPVDSFDPFGLWKQKTRGQALSEFEAEAGDTIRGLAGIRALRANQYGKWLTLGTGSMPKTADDVVCGTYKVPNTVIAYWAGWGGGFGRFWMGWGARLRALRGQGYYVEEYRFRHNTTWTNIAGHWAGSGGTPELDLQDKLTASAQARRLHGLYFWGHGGNDGLTADDKGPYQTWMIDYKTVSIPYGLGLLWVYACESSCAQPVLGSGDPGMSIEGSADGTLIPLPFGAYIDTGK